MTQPPNPGQPFYQQQPSAPSAPATGQPYPPQQQFQGVPGAPGAPGVPGQPYAVAATGDSFMGNFFDTAKPFAEKFGKVFFYIVVVALTVSWLYAAYNAGDGGSYNIDTRTWSFDFGKFLVSLLFNAPWTFVQMGLARLFLELVINSGRRGQRV